MSEYTPQGFTKGQILKADHQNYIESGIDKNEAAITALTEEIAKSFENGDTEAIFTGSNGKSFAVTFSEYGEPIVYNPEEGGGKYFDTTGINFTLSNNSVSCNRSFDSVYTQVREIGSSGTYAVLIAQNMDASSMSMTVELCYCVGATIHFYLISGEPYLRFRFIKPDGTMVCYQFNSDESIVEVIE